MNPDEVNRRLRKQSGFSLIETMIAVGIVGIIALAIATMLSNMTRQVRALHEKLAAEETFRFVTQALSASSLCEAALTSPSPIVFNSTGPQPASALPSDSIPLGGSAYAVKVGQPASPTSSTLYVSSLDLVNIRNAGSPDQWTGDVQVGFDQTKLIQPLRPVLVRITFQTDPSSPATAKKVISCGDGSQVNFNNCDTIDVYIPEGSPAVTKTCDPGYKLIWGVGFPDGSEDPVDSAHLKVTSNSIYVWAEKDSWRMLGKCCQE